MILVAACAVSAHAQSNPMSADTRLLYTMIKTNIIKAAEKMPEANYSFKPTPDVRSFGQLIGHLADAQYEFCAPVKGENKAMDLEKTLTSKAALVQALKTAFAYCDGAYDALTDATAGDKLKFFGADHTRLFPLSFNTAHSNEH